MRAITAPAVPSRAPHLRSPRRQRLAAFVHDGVQILDRLLEAIVDHDVVEFRPMRDVAPRVSQAPLDHRLGVGAARLEPLLEGLAGGRQNEDAARRRQRGTHLARALPVDLEQEQLALGNASRTAPRLVP